MVILLYLTSYNLQSFLSLEQLNKLIRIYIINIISFGRSKAERDKNIKGYNGFFPTAKHKPLDRRKLRSSSLFVVEGLNIINKHQEVYVLLHPLFYLESPT